MDGLLDAKAMLTDPYADMILRAFRTLSTEEKTAGISATNIAKLLINNEIVTKKTVNQIKMPLSKSLRKFFPKDGQYKFAGGEFNVRLTTRFPGDDKHEIRLYQVWAYNEPARAEVC